ncbi:hypothetical protein AHAS_Ahas11G0239000 [Arachis hypogaea]
MTSRDIRFTCHGLSLPSPFQDVSYHLGLWMHGEPVEGYNCDFQTYYGRDTWEMVEEALRELLPQWEPQEGVWQAESFIIKMTSFIIKIT